MADWKRELRAALQDRVVLARGSPTDAELDLILSDLARDEHGHRPDWEAALRRRVPSAGPRRLLEGEDLSDINALILMILKRIEEGGNK